MQPEFIPSQTQNTQAPSQRQLPRNPEAWARHRRQVFWQITLPAIGLGLGFVALCVLAALGEGGQISQWADISFIWLILPVFLSSFLVLAMVAGLVYLVLKLIEILPVGSFKALQQFHRLNSLLAGLNQRLTEPFIKTASAKASAKAALREIQKLFH